LRSRCARPRQRRPCRTTRSPTRPACLRRSTPPARRTTAWLRAGPEGEGTRLSVPPH
jgi:hypothetical protein